MALIDRLRKGDEMRRKSLFALLAFATAVTAVVAGMGASAAFAGESTGNCGNAATDPAGLGFKGSDKAAANCKGPLADPGTRVSNGNSWCSYSGQNDHPEGSAEQGPGGRTQNWGHTPDHDALTAAGFNPGTACNPNTTTFGGDVGVGPPRK
jgi:hypothetical protein